MKREYVPDASSNVVLIEYDTETKALHITYKNGQRYHYASIELALYDELINAKSIGSYIAHNIIRKQNAAFKTAPQTRSGKDHMR